MDIYTLNDCMILTFIDFYFYQKALLTWIFFHLEHFFTLFILSPAYDEMNIIPLWYLLILVGAWNKFPWLYCSFEIKRNLLGWDLLSTCFPMVTRLS